MFFECSNYIDPRMKRILVSILSVQMFNVNRTLMLCSSPFIGLNWIRFVSDLYKSAKEAL